LYIEYNRYKEYDRMASLEDPVPTLEVSEARRELADTINRVAYRKERIVLRRRGKDVVAIIPLEDLARLEELEDRLDVDDAREALAEGDRIPYERARRQLGLE
jgi:antitoxin Phd